MRVLSKSMLLIFSIIILITMNSCSSARVINAPYHSVAKVAKERFFQNSWTIDGTKEAVLEEGSDYITIDYYEWEFPNIKIYSEIEVQPYGKGKSKVWVYVKNCDSWWYPFSFSPELATGVLNAFENRLKWYKFGWKEMPWDKYNIEDIKE